MSKKILLTAVLSFVIISVLMSGSIIRAEDDMEERLELIEASRRLEQEEVIPSYHGNHFGVSFTSFSATDIILNPGLRLENELMAPAGRPLRLVSELYYLRQAEDIMGFLSLSFLPHERIYLGAGGELTGRADYHLFVGFNLTENLFLEARGINEGGSFSDTDIHVGTGFKFGF